MTTWVKAVIKKEQKLGYKNEVADLIQIGPPFFRTNEWLFLMLKNQASKPVALDVISNIHVFMAYTSSK